MGGCPMTLAMADKFHARYSMVERREWQRTRTLSRIPPCAQGLWLYLLTTPFLGVLPGLVTAGEAALAEDLGWPVEGFRAAFEELEASGRVRADWTARVVVLVGEVGRSFERRGPESPNVIRGWRSQWLELPQCALVREYHAELGAHVARMTEGFVEAFVKAFGKDLPEALSKASSKPSSKGSTNQDQDQNQDQIQQQKQQQSAARAARMSSPSDERPGAEGQDGTTGLPITEGPALPTGACTTGAFEGVCHRACSPTTEAPSTPELPRSPAPTRVDTRPPDTLPSATETALPFATERTSLAEFAPFSAPTGASDTVVSTHARDEQRLLRPARLSPILPPAPPAESRAALSHAMSPEGASPLAAPSPADPPKQAKRILDMVWPTAPEVDFAALGQTLAAEGNPFGERVVDLLAQGRTLTSAQRAALRKIHAERQAKCALPEAARAPTELEAYAATRWVAHRKQRKLGANQPDPRQISQLVQVALKASQDAEAGANGWKPTEQEILAHWIRTFLAEDQVRAGGVVDSGYPLGWLVTRCREYPLPSRSDVARLAKPAAQHPAGEGAAPPRSSGSTSMGPKPNWNWAPLEVLRGIAKGNAVRDIHGEARYRRPATASDPTQARAMASGEAR